MAYLVLARKWRPQRFEDVVGQEHVTTTLRNAIAQGRIAHAFLFSGPRGVGKTTVARLLAKALNCAQGPTAEPCGTCPSCVEITGGSSLDVAEIDGASNTGVDNIRDLNESVRYRPAAARFKIYIIDEVHMLSTAAFNALLKTLEEPPEHIKFIFATTEVQKLPQTVVSRCQRYEFKRLPTAEMVARLRRIVDDERLAVADAALFTLAREAEGSMRDAQSLLDQVIVFAGKEIGESEVRAALGLADRTLLHQVTAAILERDPARCLHAVEELHRFGYEVTQFCRDLVRQMRHLTVAGLFADGAMLADLPDHEVQETLRQAALRSPDDLQRLFRLAQAMAEEARRAMAPTLALEMGLLKMATMPDAPPIAELVTRLEDLERRLGRADGDGSGGRGPERSGGTMPGTRSAGGPARAPARPLASTAPPAATDPHPPAPMPQAVGAPSAPPAALGPVQVGTAATTAPPASAPSAARTEAATAQPAAGAGTPSARSVAGEPHGDGTPAWQVFLTAAREKISIRMYTSGSRLVEETADTVHIGVESEFAQRALLQRDTLRLLEDMAGRAYGGPRRIEVSVVRPPAEEVAMRMAVAETRRRELAERANQSPTVRAAVEILGGEVTDVRPRGRGGDDEPR